MFNTTVFRNLDDTYKRAPVLKFAGKDRIVIFSDLHMGDGGSTDDFLLNSNLFKHVMERYYLERGFKLILNGDVEELHRFLHTNIRERWNDVNSLFRRFQDETGAYRIWGNHDFDLSWANIGSGFHRVYDSLKLDISGRQLFMLHGHQGSPLLERFHHFNRFVLKNVAEPLGIQNFKLEIDTKEITALERRIAHFAQKIGMITVMGHTHRPLFGVRSMIPGLFNSGCAIGQRGITSIEIEEGRMSVVHWFDSVNYLKKLWNVDPNSQRMGRTDYHRSILFTGRLDDIIGSNLFSPHLG